jgi:hypothetical protein
LDYAAGTGVVSHVRTACKDASMLKRTGEESS